MELRVFAMRVWTLALGLYACVMWSPVEANENLYGVWMTSGGRSHVRVEACEDKVCAWIVWLREAFNVKGEPLRDRRNEAAELRDRPIIGIKVLQVGQNETNLWSGRVYDPERGRTYPANVTVERAGVLKVTGCSWAGWPCKTRVWQRVENGSMHATGAVKMPQK